MPRMAKFKAKPDSNVKMPQPGGPASHESNLGPHMGGSSAGSLRFQKRAKRRAGQDQGRSGKLLDKSGDYGGGDQGMKGSGIY